MRTLLQTLFFLSLIMRLLYAQTELQNSRSETSPRPAPYSNEETDITGDWWWLDFSFDVTAASGGPGNAGAEYDGTYFYTTRWASNLIHKYDINGNLLEVFSIPGVSGLRDLAFDGTYMYGGNAGNIIYQMDFNTKTLVGTISSPVAVRFIAYDLANDGFWCGNWADDPTLVSRSGTALASFSTGLQGQYGAAIQGSELYIFDQGQGAGFPQIISGWYIPSGGSTGDYIDVTQDITGTNGIAGGLFASEIFQIGGVLQGSPDMFFVYTNHWYIPPYFENFDGLTAGQKLACQNHLYWSTWDLNPCDSVADPYVSTNQSFSTPNSVNIVDGNNLVQQHQPLTYGIWVVEFKFYIPAGKTGEFGLMSQFLWADKIWGMECYFDQGGAGRLLNGDTVTFTWTEDTWQSVRVFVSINADQAEMYIDNAEIASWQWSRAATIPRKLDVSVFRGIENSDMYIDDYHFGDYIPVELTSFTADANDGSVILRWHTATETNNRGFEIERKKSEVGNQRSGVRSQPAEGEVAPISGKLEWDDIGFVKGNGTTTEPNSYSFTDADVTQGIYNYRLKQIDYDGSFRYSDEVTVEVKIPVRFYLSQNYPNPFNPVTQINYSIPEDGNVSLTIYNPLGQKTAELVNGFMRAGNHRVTFDASRLSSGIYFYQLKAGEYVETKKAIYIK